MHDTLKYFAGAMSCNGEFWSDNEAIKESLNLEGHRQVYVNDCLSYVASLRVTLSLVRGGMMDRTALRSEGEQTIDINTFTTSQHRDFVHATRLLENVAERNYDSEEKKIMMIDGEAGSGKSYLLQAIIDLCAQLSRVQRPSSPRRTHRGIRTFAVTLSTEHLTFPSQRMSNRR